MLFDTHAHLDDRAFDPDRESLIESLAAQGTGLVLNPGCDLESSRRAIALAEKYPFIYAAVGSHPDDADRVDEALTEVYRTLCRHEKVLAIGETGLDYHYETIPRAVQQQAFRLQMALAREQKLPVIVHEREAHGDALEILREFPEVTGVFHCYSGSPEMAQQLVAQGWYIGFTGVLTFKNARRAVETASQLPLERIVLETDCPYMAPEPFRGRRNHPGYLYRMAEVLAQLRQMPVEDIHRITTQNARRLYRLP